MFKNFIHDHKSEITGIAQLTFIGATLLLIAIPINATAQQSGSCQPSYSMACQNLRGTQSNDSFNSYNRIQRQNEDRQHKEYLRRNDFQNGVTQRTGPTGGIRDGGRGGWVGYQWSTQ
ncbi:hypothetical protein MUY35_15090 [Aliiroseovarius sp. S1339]|uniref:hypothetical protein n=1 Tax=Aliiroseovarius sp. S1339 TaxID=2936990 RepID=UPI0020BE017A|nr:hypothetical protein [Aliiroseovarius sp. S1339]MCK8465183.1 hypothetical protein [Aliiroseovarius sp. S1339]